VILLHHLL